jgi:hypothetical protein
MLGHAAAAGGRSPPKKCALQGLGPELLFSIACHLKPRHLYKLMRTSKTIKAAVDTEEYWARVAVHIVYMEFRKGNGDLRRAHDLPSTARYLVNMEYGYCEAIDWFINAMRELLKNGQKNCPRTSLVWKQLIDAPVSVLVMAGDSAIRAGEANSDRVKLEYYRQNKAKTPKDVVKIEVMYGRKKNDTGKKKHDIGNDLLGGFRNDLEDNTSFSRKQKAEIGTMVSELLMCFCHGDPPDPLEKVIRCFQNFTDEFLYDA